MGLIFRTYGCADCGAEVEILQTAEEGPPAECPACGGAPRPEPIPTGMRIGGSAVARSVDQTYRALEESSAARAEEAGEPALKITDLRDNLREGDVAAVSVRNEVTQVAEAMGHEYWGGGGGMNPQAVAAGAGIDKAGTGAPGIAAIQSSLMGGVRRG